MEEESKKWPAHSQWQGAGSDVARWRSSGGGGGGGAVRWVRTILSQSRFYDSIFLGGGLAHRSSGRLQAGKVRTGKRVPRMGQVRNQALRAWFRKGRGIGEPYAGRRGPPRPSLLYKGKGEGNRSSCLESQSFSQPCATRNPWIGRPVYQQASWDSVLLSRACENWATPKDLEMEGTWGFWVRIRWLNFLFWGCQTYRSLSK